jgi:hypothetical protein
MMEIRIACGKRIQKHSLPRLMRGMTQIKRVYESVIQIGIGTA